jgi:hypothetical protein
VRKCKLVGGKKKKIAVTDFYKTETSIILLTGRGRMKACPWGRKMQVGRG